MAYIIPCSSNAFVNIKLTEKGRELLSLGQLNFASYAVGCSEVDYNREIVVENNPSDTLLSRTSRILRPKDQNPELRYYVKPSSSASPLIALQSSDRRSIKAVVVNSATTRGAFVYSGGTYSPILDSPLVKDYGSVLNKAISGTTTLSIPSSVNYALNDFAMVRFSNETSLDIPVSSTTATVALMYQIQASAATYVTLDRQLPNLVNDGANGGTQCDYIIYDGSDVPDIYGNTASAYWDSGTLSFDSSCSVAVQDVPTINTEIVHSCNPIGLASGTTYQDFTYFWSYPFIGDLTYLGYNQGLSSDTVSTTCNGLNTYDPYHRKVAILNYTNYTISNFYGEYFYTDSNRQLKIILPYIMWNYKDYVGSGTTMGMSFVSSGDFKYITTNNLEYVDLIEDPTLVTNRDPQTVGKIFTGLKLVVIEDEELVECMSYKSNRNYSLPPLACSLQSPASGVGVLVQNKAAYVTYVFTNDLDPSVLSGYTTSTPCAKVVKIQNTTSGTRDIAFRMAEEGINPYMRKIEGASYDGFGYYAKHFTVLYQGVDDYDTLPDPGSWKQIDFTSSISDYVVRKSINPLTLEDQNPASNGFVLTSANTSAATSFNLIIPLGLPTKANEGYLNFGSERFFDGMLQCYIGATIYKTLFNINLNASQFTYTDNPTWASEDLRVTEIGIYDSNQNLVIIGKLSQPLSLATGSTIMLELGLDF